MTCYNLYCFLILQACNTENRSADRTKYCLPYIMSLNSYGAGIVPKYELKTVIFSVVVSLH